MASWNPYNSETLGRQIALQKARAWSIDDDIPWKQGVDVHKFLLPLDDEAVAFPGATDVQRLALSQLMGLIINATIAEMETSLKTLRRDAWELVLDSYPVNQEMRELGELFFIEELKHAQAFARYNTHFCRSMGILEQDLNLLLPKAFGSNFLSRIVANAKAGGHSFWWVVAQVEEVSIKIFQNIDRDRSDIDPLYFNVHRLHLEEEARHANYAFLMLELIRERDRIKGGGIRGWMHRKSNLIQAELWTSGWVLSELAKVYEVGSLQHKHPFFATLASALPILRKHSINELFQKLFVRSPYVSLVLNIGNHKKSLKMAQRLGAWRMPLPAPDPKKTNTKSRSKWDQAS